MNIAIVKNRYVNAMLILMLFSAATHLLIIFFSMMMSGDLYLLNFFNIVGVSYLIPNFLNSFSGNLLSFAFAAALYLIILRYNRLR